MNECQPCRLAAQKRYEKTPKGRDNSNAWRRERYAAMSGREYAHRLLQIRRHKALRRMAARHRAAI